MVIPGYISLDEQDDMEDMSFRDAWGAEKSRIHNTLNGSDRKYMQAAFDRLPHGFVAADIPSWFANDISLRVYTEWCMDPNRELDDRNPDTYHGQAFDRLISDELYLANERLSGRSSVSREQVLEAFTKRAIELFSEHDHGVWPQGVHLRGSLKELLPA